MRAHQALRVAEVGQVAQAARTPRCRASLARVAPWCLRPTPRHPAQLEPRAKVVESLAADVINEGPATSHGPPGSECGGVLLDVLSALSPLFVASDARGPAAMRAARDQSRPPRSRKPARARAAACREPLVGRWGRGGTRRRGRAHPMLVPVVACRSP